MARSICRRTRFRTRASLLRCQRFVTRLLVLHQRRRIDEANGPLLDRRHTRLVPLHSTAEEVRDVWPAVIWAAISKFGGCCWGEDSNQQRRRTLKEPRALGARSSRYADLDTLNFDSGFRY